MIFILLRFKSFLLGGLDELKIHLYEVHKLTAKTSNLLILLLFSFVLLTGCSTSQNDNLQKEMDKLTSQYEDLQKDYKNLEENYQSLQTEHENLQLQVEEYQDQQATIDDLNTKLTDIQSQYDTLQSDRDNLQQQLDTKKLAEEQAARVAQQQAQQALVESQAEGTVYWTDGGECYHSTSDCSTLKRSKNISSGTVEQSGRRPCKVCH